MCCARSTARTRRANRRTIARCADRNQIEYDVRVITLATARIARRAGHGKTAPPSAVACAPCATSSVCICVTTVREALSVGPKLTALFL